MTFHHNRTIRVFAVGAVAALVLGAPYHASAATSGVRASVKKGVLTVSGTAASDVITLRLRAGDTSTLEVDLGADGTADYAFGRALFTKIAVYGVGGQDQLTADSWNGSFTDTESTTLDGGDGSDVLVGTVGPERLVGGAGDDLLRGGVGADVVVGGDGADTVTWEPGGGNDTIDAGAGADRLLFQASVASEAVGLSATPAGHVRLTRDLASVVLDLVSVESADLHLLDGTDTVSVGDLHGTGMTAVTADLAGSSGDDAVVDEVVVPTGVVVGSDGPATVVDGLGAALHVVSGGIGDQLHVVGTSAADDRVTVAGTAGPDSISALNDASDVYVQGATPGVDLRLTAADVLAVSLAGGDDSYRTLGSVASVVALDVDGGDGSDLLSGGSGHETLRGGAGDDELGWSPGGGNDTLDGGSGADALSFAAANVSETVELSTEPDGHVRVARDISGVVLDVVGVETANLRLFGGSDHVLVDDLTGTGLTTVNADLSNGQGTSDGTADEVVLFGTPSDDVVTVTGDNATVAADGLPAQVHISGTDPTLDELTVYGMRGTDSVTASPDAASLIQLALFA